MGEQRTAEGLALVRQLCEIARAVPDAATIHPKAFKGRLCQALINAGWYCNLRARVASRGTDDHYRGILDLVAWPPFPDGIPRSTKHRRSPVLVEIEKRRISHKARAKLDAYPDRISGTCAILTRASDCEPCAGVDFILCLGTESPDA